MVNTRYTSYDRARTQPCRSYRTRRSSLTVVSSDSLYVLGMKWRLRGYSCERVTTAVFVENRLDRDISGLEGGG